MFRGTLQRRDMHATSAICTGFLFSSSLVLRSSILIGIAYVFVPTALANVIFFDSRCGCRLARFDALVEQLMILTLYGVSALETRLQYDKEICPQLSLVGILRDDFLPSAGTLTP